MRKSFWHHVPIVRLLLPFAFGIGIGMFWTAPTTVSVGALLVLLLLVVIAFVAFRSYKLRWLFGWLVNILLFVFGICLYQLRNTIPQHHFSKVQYDSLYVLVNAPLTQKSHAYKTIGVVQGATHNGHNKAASGSLLLYIDPHLPKGQLGYGTLLKIPAHIITPVQPPLNPDEFNYKRYLAFKQIAHQAYIQSGCVGRVNGFYGNAGLHEVYKLQVFFKQTLQHYLGTQNEVGIAQALLYGDDDAISQETMQAYANTGTLHVLAVSGMHVGLIFGLLLLLTSPIAQTGTPKKIKLICICLCLWGYSVICGFSPSILRATVMFSFLIIGQIFETKSSSYNTLAASALVLLCANCNMLANVGFQLSYLAVLGIVFFQPLIQTWLIPVTWLGKQIWSITAVSIAAQLITFPIGLLYFHQFPNCFLFSNLLIIPLTTIILYGILVLLACCWWPLVAGWLGVILTWLIQFTNQLVSWVESIPYAYVSGLYISIAESILWYLLIGGCTIWFWKKYKVGLWTMLAVSILLSGQHLVKRLHQWEQHRFIVFAVGNNTAAQYIKGRSSIFWINNRIDTNLSIISFQVKQHQWKSGLKPVAVNILDSNWKYIEVGQTSWIFTGASIPAKPIKATYAIVTQRLHPKALNLLQADTFIVNKSYRKDALYRLRKQVYPAVVYELTAQGAWQWFAPE